MSARCVRWFLCGCLAIVALELRLGCSLLWRSIAPPALDSERQVAAARVTGPPASAAATLGIAFPRSAAAQAELPVATLRPGVPFEVQTETSLERRQTVALAQRPEPLRMGDSRSAELNREAPAPESVILPISRPAAMETQP